MKLGSLVTLVRRDLARTGGAFATGAFGIAAGTAALVFFVALGLGVHGVVAEIFPADRVELEPPRAADPGLIGLLTGGGDAPGIEPSVVETLEREPGVTAVYPKLRVSFPLSARGGTELFGRPVGASELVGDGIDPALVSEDVEEGVFVDPLAVGSGKACEKEEECEAPQYCDRPTGGAPGVCSDPVPAVVSPYLVEIFDTTIAPAHRLPPIGNTLVERAKGVAFDVRLGESLLGKAKHGEPRTVRARVVGISSRAIDLGLTFPMPVVKRWNREFAGEGADQRYSSVVVHTRAGRDLARVIARGAEHDLSPRDTRARDVSLLVTSVTLLLSLIAAVILVVSASNIAYTFRVLVAERRDEIALYRAVGATASDVRRWLLTLAVVVGALGGALGTLVARLAALGLDRLAATRLPEFPFKPASFFDFTWWLLPAGIGFAAFFAVLGAFGPARRASAIDPVSALAGP